ncbi:hypothetical protein K432DRAFT_405962 [Lepidopterella palustris CBS 459.81]|uniref:Uncharacterized protein n=1 Tax=Lepidopterella palustris CBS 459.81 TaxID=1314670 RepID=A0A8E2E862_9PEZI|nr:hypothetical protein K432DRAFT_405962 [Lepidopterella palustris CBS 459.81]
MSAGITAELPSRHLKETSRAVKFARSSHGDVNIFAKVIEDSGKESCGIDDIDARIEAISRPELQRALEDDAGGLRDGFIVAELIGPPLCNGVIEEALRMYGAAPIRLPNVALRGNTTLTGHFISQGITASSQAYTLHRDP